MKNSVTRLLNLMIAMSLVLVITSCGNDDSPAPSCAAPTIAAPANNLNATVGQTIDVIFSLISECGVTGVDLNATGGTVSQPDDTRGSSIIISFTAGSIIGDASVTITVTDSEGQTANATAQITIEDPNTITVTENITADVTWETGKTYILAGRIAVEDGATLTIEGGTMVKGLPGEGSNATALLIARGAKLTNGTAELHCLHFYCR